MTRELVLTTLARPRARNMTASDAMNGWMSKTWTMTPIRSPQQVPMRTPTTSTTGNGAPAVNNLAVMSPTRATTAPTDRSIPPARMTKVMPTARTRR